MARRLSYAVSPVPWFGGKQLLSGRLVALLPAHRVYVEAFGGGGAVLFAKPRAERLEVYNDLDTGLVTFFRVLRDHPDELQRRLRFTPFSRHEWNDARQTWNESEDEIERARRWFVAVAQAFGAQPFGGSPVGKQSSGGWRGERLGRLNQSASETWASRVDRLDLYARRMMRVQIEELDWRACLDRYDHEDACFYLDPPYVHETRKSGGYRLELTSGDHAELVARVLELRGSVLLSGYAHELYRPLEEAGFERHEFAVRVSAASRSNGDTDRERTEIVWRRVNDKGALF